MNPNNLVCRTCLGIVPQVKMAHNIDEENGLIRNVRNIREMIMFCVPEMDSYVSINPVICESCLGVLVTVYNFKIRCMRVENAIRLYIAANNLMEGSCVNLNNVVKQQIIEALKQKKWPNEVIKEYVDKHLAASPISSDVFQAMSKSLNAPRSVGPSVRPILPESQALVNSTCMPAMNIGAPPPYPDILAVNNVSPPFGSNIPPPNATIRVSPHANTTPTTRSNYISVSRNLMPPRLESPTISQQLYDINRLSSPSLSTIHMTPNIQPRGPSLQPPRPMMLPLAQLQSALPNTSHSNMRDFQNAFLSSLQLMSTVPGGRQEAVLVRNKERKTRSTNKKKKTVTEVVAQTVAPTAITTESGNALSNTLPTSTAGTQNISSDNSEKRIMKETGLRGVRKQAGEGNKRNNKGKEGENDDVIILDDDVDIEGTLDKQQPETLIINFEENDDNADLVGTNEQATPINTNGTQLMQTNATTTTNTNGTLPEPTKTIDFCRKMVVKLPQLDKETLKRKLTPDDIIEEIESKRRKMVVRLSSSLPYLHKNKRLQVKVAQDRIFACSFCKFASLRYRDLRKHYLGHHKVCSICGFKTDRSALLTQHLNMEHDQKLQEALKKSVEKKSTLQCYICKFSGLSDTDLKDHRLRIHIKCDSEGMYKCPYEGCTKKEEAIAYNMLRHIENVHDKEKQTQCPLCNYRAPSASHVRNHVRTHSLIRMKCHMCLFTYKSNMALQRHIARNHSNVGSKSMTGMAYATPSAADGPVLDDDYRITLDNLRAPGTQPEPRRETTTNNSQDENRMNEENLNVFNLPSLTEMLCSQTFMEEASDQEGDCTIVSDEETPSISAASRRKSTESRTEGDSTDCLIINQEIPTVAVSDDEESTTSSKRKRRADNNSRSSSDNSRADSDVIEIDDRNDHEDCFVVSDNCVESSTQTASENIETSNTGGSETDTCSPAPPAADKTTQQSEVTANEIETSSEPSASQTSESGNNTKERDISLESHDKEKSYVPSENLTSEKETETPKKNNNKDHGETTPDMSSPSTSKNKEVSESAKSTDKSMEQNSSDMTENEACKNTEESDSAEQNKTTSDNISSTEDTAIQKPVEDKTSPEVENGNQNQDGNELTKTSKESQKETDIVPDVEQSKESVLIESSDEDSNDCTFVSETGRFKSNSSETVKANEEVENDFESSEALQSESAIEAQGTGAAEKINDDAGTSESLQSGSAVEERTPEAQRKNDSNLEAKETGNEASTITAKDKTLGVPKEIKSVKNKSDDEVGEIEKNQKQTQVSSDPNPDSDNNAIISDSEADDIQKSPDIELTMELTKVQLPTTDDTEILNSDPLLDSEIEEASKSSQQSLKELSSEDLRTDLEVEVDKLLENSDNSSDKEISVLETLNLKATDLESAISTAQEIGSTAKLDLLDDIFDPIVTGNPVENMTIDPLEDLDTLQTAEESLISVLETTNSIFPESRVNFDSVLKEFDIGIKEGMDVTEDNSVNETSTEDLLKCPKSTSLDTRVEESNIESILKESRTENSLQAENVPDSEPSTSKSAVNTWVESKSTKDKTQPVEKTN